jgi:hypothetical protein
MPPLPFVGDDRPPQLSVFPVQVTVTASESSRVRLAESPPPHLFSPSRAGHRRWSTRCRRSTAHRLSDHLAPVRPRHHLRARASPRWSLSSPEHPFFPLSNVTGRPLLRRRCASALVTLLASVAAMGHHASCRPLKPWAAPGWPWAMQLHEQAAQCHCDYCAQAGHDRNRPMWPCSLFYFLSKFKATASSKFCTDLNPSEKILK